MISPFRSLSFTKEEMPPIERAPTLPFLFYLRSSHSFISLSVAAILFTNSFLYGLIVPVLPFSLQSTVGVSKDDVQLWVSILLGCYGAGVALGSVIFGRITYRNQSHRIPSFFGLVLLLASTITMAYARTLPILVTARFIQGLGSAVLFSVSLTLLAEVYRHRPETIDLDYDVRLVTLATSGGILLGPAVGGALYECYGYSAVFITAVALIAVDVVLELMLIERKEAMRHLLDDDEESDGARTPLLRVRRRPMSLRRGSSFVLVIRKRRLAIAIFGLFAQGVIVTGLEAALPLHLRNIYSWAPDRLGFAFLPLLLPLILSPFLSHLCYRIGNRFVTVFGFTIASISLFMLRFPTVFFNASAPESIAIFGVLLAVLGVGLGCVITSVLTEVFWGYEEIEKEQPGRFGAVGAIVCAHMVSNGVYCLGIMIGPIVAGLLKHYVNFDTMTLCLAVYCLLNAIPVGIFYGNVRRDDDVDADYSHPYSPPRSIV